MSGPAGTATGAVGAAVPVGVDQIADADDSHHRRAIRAELDTTLFVEAGAGTGKTTALVARIVQLVVQERTTIDHIAAITFTEKAAGELRDRVREALERVASGTWSDEHAPSHPPEDAGRHAELARAALADLDAAAITTLHGFAIRILEQFPFDAGLPPRIQPLDELHSTLAFADRWAAFVDELLDDPTVEPLLVRALISGITLRHLQGIARALNENWDLVSDHTFVEPPPVTLDARPVLALLDDATRTSAGCTSPADRLLAHIEGLAPFIGRLRAAIAGGDEADVLRLLRDAPRLSCRIGRAENWPDVKAVRALLAEADHAATSQLARIVDHTISSLVCRLAERTLAWATERRLEGSLEFHDLLVLSRSLLRRDPAVGEALRQRYHHLLIDEFQDTDPIQAELAVRIAAGGDAPPGADWRDLEVPPGRLFFVGDAKQAIYRFRRADISLFLTLQERFGRPVRSLTMNRRSVPGIIDLVNTVFGQLIGSGTPDAQPAYQALTGHRPSQPGGPPVVLLGGPAAGSLNEIREVEAEEIAAACKAVRDEGWAVGPDARPARLADITVLIPSRTSLPALEDAFEDGGIPYRLDAASLVYASLEVQELLMVARAIDDPTNDVAVVGALRSSLFGCGDDDLLTFHRHVSGWNYLRPAPDPEVLPADHPVVAGMAALRELHHDRTWVDLSQLLGRIVRRRRVMELALDAVRPRDVWRRLTFVIDQARSFTDTAGNDLRAWLAWVDLLIDGDIRLKDTVLPETDDDAVRIMTVHSSKGLEFPVVILTGLNVAAPAIAGVNVFWPEAGAAPVVGITKELHTAGYPEHKGHEVEMDELEAIRLLYVATTRAMDHLVVSVHHKIPASAGRHPANHAQRLHELLAAHPDLWRRIADPPPLAAPPRTDPAGSVPVDTGAASAASAASEPDTAALRDAWIAERAERLAAIVPAATSATAVAKAIEAIEASRSADGVGAPTEDAALDKEAPDPDAPGWRRGRAGTAIGRAVHGTLQLLDFTHPHDLAAIAASQAAAEGVVEHTARVVALAEAALAAPVVRAASSTRHWRELYVAAPIGAQVLEGFIDLLVDDPVRGLTVVDYKTDALDDADLEASLDTKLARYRAQAASYAVLVEDAVGRPVDRCVFVFLRGAGAIEREITDLDAAKADVRAFLGAAV